MSKKKCRGCKKRFNESEMIRVPLGFYHSYDCATNHAKSLQQAKKQKTANALHRKRKAALKPKNSHLSEAQAAVNAFVRFRDRNEPCINTGEPVGWSGNDSDAAHFYSRGANAAMRFDLRNINKSTKKANKDQERYIHDYRERLIEKLGPERFSKFEADAKHWKKTKRNFSTEYLIRIKRIFRKRLRIYKKINGY